ncbi:hypothetical protein KFU94_09095 [Chloroflexi bacterium TSY]|nr:hypothetical protein [Chloroflexi bacterium TSY]
MNHLQKSRVTVDFFMHERDALQMLCEQDIRPPQEQLRWLVMAELRRRNADHIHVPATPSSSTRHGVNRVSHVSDKQFSTPTANVAEGTDT